MLYILSSKVLQCLGLGGNRGQNLQLSSLRELKGIPKRKEKDLLMKGELEELSQSKEKEETSTKSRVS